mmetsp:Transcript_22427/g.73644  ORF Transcript_22427/g.73644 Transcript_22427/m.73644 type:complete len:96 (-) Transcript_22427:28-315(-)
MLAKRGDEGLFSTVECSINLCIIDHRLGQEHKNRHSSNCLQASSYDIILTDCMEGPLSMDTDTHCFRFDSCLSYSGSSCCTDGYFILLSKSRGFL